MSKRKPFKELVVSPKGEVTWCSLVPEDDYNKTGKQFSCRLRWEKKDPAFLKFKKKLDKLAKKAYEFFQADDELKVILKKKMKLVKPYTDEYDKEGEETGYYVVNSKNKYKFTTKKGKVIKNNLTVLDAKKQQIDNDSVTPYRGSIVRFQAMAFPYFMISTKEAGISLRLLAVQVIKPVSGGEQVDTDMFEEEEGFTSEEASPCNFEEGEEGEEENVGEEYEEDEEYDDEEDEEDEDSNKKKKDF